MANIEDVKAVFRTLSRPSQGEKEWESPYRLLGGALYSIRRGLTSNDSARDVPLPETLPLNWTDLLLRHTEHGIRVGRNEEWIHIWAASYMFTNAVFRIASATEKVAGLAAGKPGRGRDVIGDFKDKNKTILPGLRKAHEYLESLPGSDKYTPDQRVKKRANLLAGARNGTLTPYPALVCAIIQADSDKHASDYPRKDLEFDCDLAMRSFLEACTVFNQAIRHSRSGAISRRP